MPTDALVWVIERDDGDVMERFAYRHEAEKKFATDLYDRSEYRVAQRWLPAVPEPLWVGWRLRKAQCECGSRFKTREAYEAHWLIHGGQGDPRAD